MTQRLRTRIENNRSDIRHKEEVDQILGTSTKASEVKQKPLKVYELVRLILDEDIDDEGIIEIEESERPMKANKNDVIIRRFNDKLKIF